MCSFGGLLLWFREVDSVTRRKRLKKISKTIFVVVGIFAFVFLVGFSYVNNWPGWYKSNRAITEKENVEMKKVVISEIRKVYTEIGEGEGLLIIEHDYMDTLEKMGDQEYQVVVHAYYPYDWTFYCQIGIESGKFVMIDMQADP